MEFLEPGRGRGPQNIVRVAEGDSDFCLTSVHHYLSALQQSEGGLTARFVAIVVRHSPIGAIVHAESPVVTPDDLEQRRIAASPDKPHGSEFLMTLRHLGYAPSELVELAPEDVGAGLARGEVDALVEFVDALPRLRRLAGCSLRAVPVGLPIYASGLVAADRLSDELVDRMRIALVRALRSQRADPKGGLAELVHRYPEVSAADAVEGWQLIEPYIFGGNRPGEMDTAEWHETLRLLCRARGLPMVEPDRVHRSELCVAPPNHDDVIRT